MDCKQARALIQQYFDGETTQEVFQEHLKHCADCHAYFSEQQKQQKLLASLRPQNIPAFDLSAAKASREAQRRKKLRRLTAVCASAAAVFIAVVSVSLSGIGFSKSSPAESAAIAEGQHAPLNLFDEYVTEESAAEEPTFDMESPVEESIPETETIVEEEIRENSTAEDRSNGWQDDANKPSATAAPGDEDFSCAYLTENFASLPAEQYNALLADLKQNNIEVREYQNHFSISVTPEKVDALSELLLSYTNHTFNFDREIYIRKH